MPPATMLVPTNHDCATLSQYLVRKFLSSTSAALILTFNSSDLLAMNFNFQEWLSSLYFSNSRISSAFLISLKEMQK